MFTALGGFGAIRKSQRCHRPGARPALEYLEGRCLLAAGYLQTNLVSDIPGLAAHTDPNLVNAWGIAPNPTGAIWVANNGTGTSTLYNGSGQGFPTASPLVVTIPPPAGSTGPAAPTGVVYNGTGSFVVSKGAVSGPALFLFATEDGTISGWNQNADPTNAILEVDNSASGAVYKGLALDSTPSGNFLLAANFHSGKIDVFGPNFAPAQLTGSFIDPGLPAGFAPFNVAALGGKIYVTYARQNDARHDDVAGPGNGFIDTFDTSGNFLGRFASGGTLNSPWGLALAPASFGAFKGALLVGNFGDGHINAFALPTTGQPSAILASNPAAGTFLGQLADSTGNPLVIDGLWGLTFGAGGASSGNPNTLYFTAGLNGEQNGLFGSLQPAPQTGIGSFDRSTGTWYLRNEASAGFTDAGSFAFGGAGWFGLVGDWTGTGQDTVAVVDPATETWYIRTTNASGFADITPFQYGLPGWIPVAGDWTGTGHDGIGVVDPRTETWYLRNEVGAGPAETVFQYGLPGWIPVTGDWSGSGHSGIGVVDPMSETWYLRNSSNAGLTDIAPFQYGAPGWVPVAGDWGGLGHSGIGVFDPGTATWYLGNSPSSGFADITPFAFGAGTWTPVAGTFTTSTVAVPLMYPGTTPAATEQMPASGATLAPMLDPLVAAEGMGSLGDARQRTGMA